MAKNLSIQFARRARNGFGTLADKVDLTFRYLGCAFSDPNAISLCGAKAVASIPDYCKTALTDFQQSVPDNFYTSVRGEDTLLSALSLRAKNQGLFYNDKQNILVTAGGVNAFYALCHAICDEGDVVLALSPSYILFSNAAKTFGAEMVLVPSHRRNGKFTIDADMMERQIEDLLKAGRRIKAVLAVNPTNIDSQCWTQDEIDRLAPIIEKYGLPVIEDRVYDGLQYDPPEQAAFFANHPLLAEHTTTIDSVSKRYGATQWRIGWVYGPKQLIDHARAAVVQSVWSPNSKYQTATALMVLAELAAQGVYDDDMPLTPKAQLHSYEHAAYMDNVKKEYLARRNLCLYLINGKDSYGQSPQALQMPVENLETLFAESLSRYPNLNEGFHGFEAPIVSQAGMFLLIQARQDLMDRLLDYENPDLLLARLLYKEEGIVCLPPTELTLPEQERMYRIEFGVPLDDLMKSLDRISSFSKRLLSSTPQQIAKLVQRHMRESSQEEADDLAKPHITDGFRDNRVLAELVHSPA